ncbi:MAG: DUF4105 domain-containing protein [Cyclobacteriaceae bacterium]|nr:DUF4105 domain-containing protein [Cyclobacteriaceae bacterium]
MKHIFILLILVVFSMFAFGETIELSHRAKINVVTCGPGQGELYEAFGHSAYHVFDPANGIDYIYNYGVFDFDQPNFYLNFARGYLNYKLDRQEYSMFVEYYIYFNRSVVEQELNLNKEEKQKLFEFLENNFKPENQYYYYDYFYDNCATRIRDALSSALDDRVSYYEGYVNDTKTIRELTDDHLKYQPWGDLGIDICLGLPMDKVATPFMYMFLPDYIYKAFEKATIKEKDGVEKPLVLNTYEIFNARPQEIEVAFFTPLKTFWLVFLLFLLVFVIEWKKNLYFRWVDIIWFSVLGLLGLFLLLLWFGTNHLAAAGNLNLLWAWPLYLLGLFYLIKKQERKLYIFYRYHGFLALLVVVMWFFIPQDMHTAFFPLALVSLLRSYRIQNHFKNAA